MFVVVKVNPESRNMLTDLMSSLASKCLTFSVTDNLSNLCGCPPLSERERHAARQAASAASAARPASRSSCSQTDENVLAMPPSFLTPTSATLSSKSSSATPERRGRPPAVNSMGNGSVMNPSTSAILNALNGPSASSTSAIIQALSSKAQSLPSTSAADFSSFMPDLSSLVPMLQPPLVKPDSIEKRMPTPTIDLDSYGVLSGILQQHHPDTTMVEGERSGLSAMSSDADRPESATNGSGDEGSKSELKLDMSLFMRKMEPADDESLNLEDDCDGDMDEVTPGNSELLDNITKQFASSTRKDGYRGLCHVCNRIVSTRSHHMRRHAIRHLGLKRWKCDCCGRLFSRADLAKPHYEKFHPGMKTMPFSNCMSNAEIGHLERMTMMCFPGALL